MQNDQSLYKFLAPERIDVLEKNLLRFTQATSFNDPFETLPFTESLFDPGFMETALDEFARRRPSLAPVLSLLRETMIRTVNLDSPEAKETAAEFLQNFFDSRYGCLCLSAAEGPVYAPANLLMWSHYADCHKGFVLGFQREHPYFHQRDPRKPYFGEITPVSYKLERPSGPVVNDPTDIGPAIYYQFAVRFFLHKSIHWKYEKEWRLIRELDSADASFEVDGDRVFLFSFPPEAVSSVVLGCRIGKETENKIRGLLASEKYRHVTLYRARIDREEFKLNIEAGDDRPSETRESRPDFHDPENRERMRQAWESLLKIIDRR